KRHKYIESAVNFAIVRKFRKYGVEIPFPQRDLHLRSSIPVPLDTLEKAAPRPDPGKRSSDIRKT
ncbi:MAG: mechanosensitive ion channel family protein, partial [Candidatus Aminicenantes bacterium]|nr:mechanosensitive ion channel family protein [Candidatus Aminicenantes bacterium]